ncbi:ATP-binding protein [Streptomyces sp. URMC 126]|uniref:sensor histidine kinase n=1 Tax=Streptomyces sp. URMC 126 TaxID=3423401 RepID=UPI003F19D7F4
MMPITEAVSLGLVAGTATAAVIAAPLLVRARRVTARLRGELTAATEYGSRLADRQRAWREELEHLAGVRLPAVLEGTPEADVPGPLYAVPEGDAEAAALAAHHEALLRRTADAVRALKDRTESGRAAFLVMADRIQVMALAQQQGLDVLEQSAEDSVLMAGLMRADHAAAQLARQAQTMKVLCGAWPGRQWPEAVSLLDVVRGAQSRILEYQRVRVQGARDAAVEPRAVEALIHAVAELLDNATRYSPPTVTVLVAIRPVHSGAVIEIDDGGLGMTEQDLAEAEVRLGGGSAAQGRGLGAKPQLGLSAVGLLARRYGFSVKLDSPSAYGGVRAVVLVPSALLTQGTAAPATPAPPRAPGLREQAEREHAERQRRRRPQRAERRPYGDALVSDAPVSGVVEAEETDAGVPPKSGGTALPEAPGGTGSASYAAGEHHARAVGELPQRVRPKPAERQEGAEPPVAGGVVGGGTDPRHPGDPAAVVPEAVVSPTTPGGLPRRRSRRAAGGGASGPVPRSSAHSSASAAPRPEPLRSPQQAAAFMSSLQAGTRLGREEAAAAPRTPQATMAAEATGPVGPSGGLGAAGEAAVRADVAQPARSVAPAAADGPAVDGGTPGLTGPAAPGGPSGRAVPAESARASRSAGPTEPVDAVQATETAEPTRPREPNDSERESR